MTVLLPVMLVALTAGTRPLNEPASERLPAAPSLHSALARPSSWRLPEPDLRRGQTTTRYEFTAPVVGRKVARPRHSAAAKVGAGVVGALVGFYIGASVGGAIDCGTDC